MGDRADDPPGVRWLLNTELTSVNEPLSPSTLRRELEVSTELSNGYLTFQDGMDDCFALRIGRMMIPIRVN